MRKKRQVTLSLSEQLVYEEVLRHPTATIDMVHQAVQARAGHPYARGLVVEILKRLNEMGRVKRRPQQRIEGRQLSVYSAVA